MPPAVMARKAVPATARAPTAKYFVLAEGFMRDLPLRLARAALAPGRFGPVARDHGESVRDEHDRRHDVGGGDELPAALEDAGARHRAAPGASAAGTAAGAGNGGA